MPTNDPQGQLEWNATNLDQVISDLYREIETDENLRQRLLNTPYDVLRSRIAIPESYSGGVFVADKGRDTMMLYVPPRGAAVRAELPEGTSEASPQPNYELLCTPTDPW